MKLGMFIALSVGFGAGCTTALPVCSEPDQVQWKPPEKSYVRIDFAMESEGMLDQTAEVRQTPAYRDQLPRIRTVAIRAPNACLDRTADQQTGRDRENEVIMQTTCSIYLKELEQGLASVGYRVVSWDVLDRAERMGDVSTYEAAANLDAQVVFIVNSLETPMTNVGEQAEYRFNYFVSNPRGEGLAPLELTEADQAKFVERVLARIPALAGGVPKGKVLAATLDTTAVAVPSGESIWFFRRSTAEFSDDDLSAALYRKFLFATLDGTNYWGAWPEGLAKPATKVAEKTSSSSSTTSFSWSKKGEDSATEAYRKRQQAMVRKIVGEFALKFSKGATE